MKRVPVVPWSIAPTYFAISPPLRLGLDDAPGDQDVSDEEVVDVDTDDSADQRRDDRDEEVPVGARERRVAVASDEGQQAGAEVARRVDRVTAVGAEGVADRQYRQPDEQRRHVGLGREVWPFVQRED